jgi:hypothetical protein
MAEHAPITSAPIGATFLQRAEELRTAAESIACLVELVSDQLADLRTGVRQHGTDAADTAEWRTADILLHLAVEQAALIQRCAESERCQ